jgi:hypothetical protein
MCMQTLHCCEAAVVVIWEAAVNWKIKHELEQISARINEVMFKSLQCKQTKNKNRAMQYSKNLLTETG